MVLGAGVCACHDLRVLLRPRTRSHETGTGSRPGPAPRSLTTGKLRPLSSDEHGQRHRNGRFDWVTSVAWMRLEPHTARMYRSALGALALGLAISGCTATRQPISTGCVTELMFQGTPYCTYGDTTTDDRYSPTNPLGPAQPWHDGEAIRHKRRCRSEGSTSSRLHV